MPDKSRAWRFSCRTCQPAAFLSPCYKLKCYFYANTSHMFPETIRVLCLLIIGYVVQNERTDN